LRPKMRKKFAFSGHAPLSGAPPIPFKISGSVTAIEWLL
jgi:hypothetical protein